MAGEAQPASFNGCPYIGMLVQMSAPYQRALVWGDVNCDGRLDVVDALDLVRHFEGLPDLATPQPCPHLGDLVNIVEAAATPQPSPSPTSTYSFHYQEQVLVHSSEQRLGSIDFFVFYDSSSAQFDACSVPDLFRCKLVEPGTVHYFGAVSRQWTPVAPLAIVWFTSPSKTKMSYAIHQATDSEGNPICITLAFDPDELGAPPITGSVTATPLGSQTPSPTPSTTPTVTPRPTRTPPGPFATVPPPQPCWTAVSLAFRQPLVRY